MNPTFIQFLWIGLILMTTPSMAVTENQSLAERAPIILGQGEQRLIRIPGLLKYSLGSTIIRATPLSLPHLKVKSPQQLRPKEVLLLKGVAPGTSDLWIWKQDGSTEFRTIRVEKIPPLSTHPALERGLSKLKETEIVYSGKGVVLRGEIQSLTESAQISSLLQVFPTEIYNETILSEDLLETGRTKLSDWLIRSPNKETLRIERVDQTLWLRGHLDRPIEKIELEKHARALFPLIKIDIESLPDYAPTVHFKVFLLELKKSQFSSLGLLWPNSTQGTLRVTSPSSLNPSSSSGLNPFLNPLDPIQIDLALQQLEGGGHARILSNPELAVRAPGEAELFAGGELPIQTQNRFHSNVTWKNYGLTLHLKITHCAGNRVRLEILTEISHLDGAVSQDKIPGIQVNRMKTQVDAHFGSALFLSGLLQQGIREEAKGLPLLRSIPILGMLFGSKDYLNERSELVVILYPHATPPAVPDEKQTHLLPKGPLPLPRNWITPQEERVLRESDEFPWNVL